MASEILSRPETFSEFLNHHGLIEDIYGAMSSPDTSEVVMTFLRVLRKTSNLPKFVTKHKSETDSTNFRNEGNREYANKNHQYALILYNKALLHAPKSSRAMKLAYSNRSALLLKVEAFTACLRDIETCFSLGCPLDIVEKLRKRKENAKSNLWLEKLAEDARHNVFPDKFFQFNVKRNPQIPCASIDVGVIVENQVPKIVATTNVKVGTVLAIETAFVSENDPRNESFSCYYCHKMNFNLRPCDGCCVAMFCDEDCKQKCLNEYHNIECPMTELIDSINTGHSWRLAFKAALKIVNSAKNWKEVITATQKLGYNRIRESSINHIYDRNYIYSLLSSKDERHFLYGTMYNQSFLCASVIHYLDKVAGFFPQNESERDGAMRAFARLLMYFNLYSIGTQIVDSVLVNEEAKVEVHNTANTGWFSFAGKLRNCCNPNVLVVGLGKKIALVATQPIKRGTELTVSYLGHWLDNFLDRNVRQKRMYMWQHTTCKCVICSGDYELLTNASLTEMQRKNFRKLNLDRFEEHLSPSNIPEMFTKLCKMLAFLNDVPFTEEYARVYKMFRQCLAYYQDMHTDNIILNVLIAC